MAVTGDRSAYSPEASLGSSGGGGGGAGEPGSDGGSVRIDPAIDALFAQVEYDVYSIERRIRSAADDRISDSIARAREMCNSVFPVVIGMNARLTASDKSAYRKRLRAIETRLSLLEKPPSAIGTAIA
jgi:hypothetical protein